jgi:hypothetical protein
MSPRTKNIIKGIGSVMEICPPSRFVGALPFYTPPEADLKNLRSDVEKIAKDFHWAMETVGGQKDKK